MKYFFLSLCLLFISACANHTVQAPSVTAKPLENTPDIAVTSDDMCIISNDDVVRRPSMPEEHQTLGCEHQHFDGVAEVIHPTEPVVIPLPEPVIIKAEAPDDLWVYIAENLRLEIPQNQARLEQQKDWYLKHPTYMRRVATRARPFLYYIVEQLELHDMPLDIALLPIVESGFDPFAYSPGRAAGIWQFIPESGKRFGMPQNWWYDGRRDVIASTQGAIKYLGFLYNMFDGNWMHALAAYNSGEGRVQRAIRKNKRLGKPTDFWSLDLPRETRAYVPKLLALADMLRSGDKYNFTWPEIANAPVVQAVDVGSQIDLAVAAQMAQLSLTELHALNPGYNKWATDPNGPHTILLPIDKAPIFTQALAQIPVQERLNWDRYKVKSGDSIGEIAQAYNTNIDVIKSINKLSSSTIYIGDYLLVPVPQNASQKEISAYALSNAQTRYQPNINQQNKTKITYIVRNGDSLWDISRAYGVSITQLSRWNRMSRNDTLSVGKQLVIWTDNKQNTSQTTRDVTYKVRTGDSLSKIANTFKISVNDIVRWNGLSINQYLQPGQRLKLKVEVTKS